MQLRNLTIPGGAAFAPMAGLSDAACRRLMADHGAAWTVSEMASAKAITFGDRKSLALLRDPDPHGLYAVQLFGNEPELLGQAIGILRETLIAQGIAVSSFGADFNYVLISQLQWFSNVVTFAISLFLGLFTNRFYMGHVFRQIKALKARRSSLTDSQLGGVLKAHGGVSRGAVLVLAIVVFGLTFTASYFIVGLL